MRARYIFRSIMAEPVTGKTAILEGIQAVFERTFHGGIQVTESMRAEDLPEWDSITHATLLLQLEKKFGILFDMGEVEASRHIAGLVRIIESKVAGRTGNPRA
jgi:acyl carrier protein